MVRPIYLDYNATTPVDPLVLEAMLPYFSEQFGNPSSKSHSYGWFAAAAVEKARKSVAGLIGLSEDRVYFTSGATESINLALRGSAVSMASRGRHIVTSSTEHAAAFETCQILAKFGFEISYVNPDETGSIRVEDVLKAVRPDTIIVSIIWANNETGVVNPILELTETFSASDILVMSDGTQTVGKMDVDSSSLDIFCASGHKFYGPKGSGILGLSNRAKTLIPQITGGGQEGGLRGGTSNAPAIVGVGKAADLLTKSLREDQERMLRQRDKIEESLQEELEDISINGAEADRLVQTSNLCFHGVRTDKLLRELREIAASPGSACSSGSSEPSRVLKAMGLSDKDALSSVRLSLGRQTTDEEIELAIEHLIAAVRKSRK